jgi:putative Mg2+ transporter-C (MgtC) family protein|tara:strand:+ start:227 stop:760 length:534 start_codon:yes stop_codon:yes gene_type:complete
LRESFHDGEATQTMYGEFEIFPFTALEEAEMLLRVALAALVGGMIGYERRRSAAPAGIRTLSLVAMGSGTFTVISIFAFSTIEGEFVRDPARIAAQVATGIGFIGAGTIIRSGTSVRGLTTATGIWVAAGLGMAAGSGLYVLAVGGAALAMVILAFFPRKPDNGHGEDEDDLEGVQL